MDVTEIEAGVSQKIETVFRDLGTFGLRDEGGLYVTAISILIIWLISRFFNSCSHFIFRRAGRCAEEDLRQMDKLAAS